MLLLWGTLHPHGSSNLASIRFSGPARIRSIRIFPPGASLFAQNPEALSQTEPDAFTLSVFLNAQAAPSAQESKPKGTNVLVPTTLIYPGGLREFPLDMGADFVTRLMVIQGDFVRVTLAVYGDAVSELSPDPTSYEPTPLPTPYRHPLSPSLDVANAMEPSVLSRELLALTPCSPSLPSAIRLTFCGNPDNEEWGSDRFTNLEACLESDISGLEWLERVADALITPIHEGVHVDLLKKVAERISQACVEKTNDHLFVLAGLLLRAASQREIVICTILDSLTLSDILESHLLDEHILERLHVSAANPTIAHALGSVPIMSTLQYFRDAYTTSRPAKRAAIALQQRVVGWERFEKALSTPLPDLAAVALWIKSFASQDLTLGIFLLSMLEKETFVFKIGRFPVPESPASLATLWNSTSLASVSEFVAFLRAFLGLAYVVVALCWADRVADTPRTEQILAMLRLWQEIDGYREIVNQLLLLPQLLYRLESMLRHASSPPDLAVVLVKQLSTCLCNHPESMTRPEMASLIDALIMSFSHISDGERSELREVAAIAEGGLSQAIHVVFTRSNQPLDTIGGCAIQGALLILEKALEDREAGEWNVMQSAWQDGSHGLVYQLVDLLGEFVVPVQGQFLLTPQTSLSPSTLVRLLSSSNAIMRILSRLLPGNPLPRRLNRTLVQHITTLFIATDAVDSRYPQGSAARQAARVARPTCAETISVLSSITDDSGQSGTIGEAVLRTLLHTGLHPEGDDPVARLEQVFWLLDLVLPLSISDTSGDRTEEKFWTRNIIANVLPELWRFSRALSIDHQVQLVERLTALDRGEIGLNHWFFSEELKHMLHSLKSSKVYQLDSERQLIFQARVTKSFQFLTDVIGAHSTCSTPEFFEDHQTLQDVSRVLAELLDCPLMTARALDFACTLAPYASFLDLSGRLNLVITLLRNAVSQPSALLHVGSVVPLLGQVPEQDVIKIAAELGPTLHRLTGDESYWQHDEGRLAEAVASCLSWLVGQATPIIPLRISEVSFTTLVSRLVLTAPQDPETISDIGFRFAFSDDNDIVLPPAQDPCESLTISQERLLELLNTRPKTPTTPRLSGESIFKMATMSPIAALVGSAGASTLTKTYQNNDFRQLSVRQNTSRRPSMHVDVGI